MVSPQRAPEPISDFLLQMAIWWLKMVRRVIWLAETYAQARKTHLLKTVDTPPAYTILLYTICMLDIRTSRYKVNGVVGRPPNIITNHYTFLARVPSISNRIVIVSPSCYLEGVVHDLPIVIETFSTTLTSWFQDIAKSVRVGMQPW
jgi:hypothetical protein